MRDTTSLPSVNVVLPEGDVTLADFLDAVVEVYDGCLWSAEVLEGSLVHQEVDGGVGSLEVKPRRLDGCTTSTIGLNDLR